jgi:hypothetical protein
MRMDARREMATAKFLEKHIDADYIVVDADTKEPVEAQYFNKTSEAYEKKELASFFSKVNLAKEFKDGER